MSVTGHREITSVKQIVIKLVQYQYFNFFFSKDFLHPPALCSINIIGLFENHRIVDGMRLIGYHQSLALTVQGCLACIHFRNMGSHYTVAIVQTRRLPKFLVVFYCANLVPWELAVSPSLISLGEVRFISYILFRNFKRLYFSQIG